MEGVRLQGITTPQCRGRWLLSLPPVPSGGISNWAIYYGDTLAWPSHLSLTFPFSTCYIGTNPSTAIHHGIDTYRTRVPLLAAGLAHTSYAKVLTVICTIMDCLIYQRSESRFCDSKVEVNTRMNWMMIGVIIFAVLLAAHASCTKMVSVYLDLAQVSVIIG